MKILFSTILALLFTTAVLGESSPEDPTTTIASTTSPVTTETSISTTVSELPTTTTTPEPPTTTPEPPTTTPELPTTTPEPVTTTVLSTTSSSTSSSTTTTRATSTSVAPPTKPPNIDECSWNVTQNNVTCIRTQLKALFIIPIHEKTEYIVVTQNATDEKSSCFLSNDTQKLVLTESSYTLTMIFAKEADKVFVNETTLEYSLPEGRGLVSSDVKIFTVKVGNSYMCRTLVNVKLDNVTMEIQDMHIQAFGGQGKSDFGEAEECEADDKVSDAVPIAVGCALAALIIIVLIAYLVGRRQSRQKGYQSV